MDSHINLKTEILKKEILTIMSTYQQLLFTLRIQEWSNIGQWISAICYMSRLKEKDNMIVSKGI